MTVKWLKLKAFGRMGKQLVETWDENDGLVSHGLS